MVIYITSHNIYLCNSSISAYFIHKYCKKVLICAKNKHIFNKIICNLTLWYL